MKNLFPVCVMVVFVGLFHQGCTGKAVIGPKIRTVEVVPIVPVPDWVKDTSEFWKKKDQYCYRGRSEGFTDLDASIRDAIATARINIGEQIKLTLRNDFSRALESQKYDQATGGYISDAFVSAVNNIDISGSVHTGSYSEKIAEQSEESLKVYWRTFVLVMLPFEEYKKAVRRAFEDMKKQVRANESVKELAEETEKRFWKMEEERQAVSSDSKQ